MAMLVRRDAQAARLLGDAASMERKIEILAETLRRKRKQGKIAPQRQHLSHRLCASVREMLTLRGNLPFPARGGSQVAITAALIVQAVTQLEDAQPIEHGDAQPSKKRAVTVREAEKLLMAWLESITSRGSFHEGDVSAYSIATRQLLPHECSALGMWLQAQLQSQHNESLQSFVQLLRKGAGDGEESSGPSMTHCNQLQLLSAARLTKDLDFAGCNFRGCRMVTGTQVYCSNVQRNDFSNAMMPECSFVACDMRGSHVRPRSVKSTTPGLYMNESLLTVAYTPDGTALVGGDRNGGVRLWDSCSGVELMVLQGHKKAVLSVAVSGDGSIIASGSEDCSARIWDARSGALIRDLNKNKEMVRCVAISTDGTLIASGGTEIMIRVWNIATGELVKALLGWPATSVCFSPSTPELTSTSNDRREIFLWDLSGAVVLVKDPARKLEGHTNAAITAVFSPNGSLIASGSRDNTVKIWDARTGAVLRTMSHHDNSVNRVDFSLDGTRVVSASMDATVRQWDVASGTQLCWYRHLFGGDCDSVAFSPDGCRIASGASLYRSLGVWDATRVDEMWRTTGHKERVVSLATSKDLVASGSLDTTIRLWNLITGEELRILRGHTGYVNCLSFSPDGKRLVSGGGDKAVRIWDIETGMVHAVFTDQPSEVVSISFSPKGEVIVLTCGDEARVLEAATGAAVQVFAKHTALVKGSSFSPDGTRIVTASYDKSVRVWEASSGTEVSVLEHTSAVMSACFSPDGSRIATGGMDYIVRVWDAQAGAVVHALRGHYDTVSRVAFAPNGRHIASVSFDCNVRLWDSETGAQVRRLRYHLSWGTVLRRRDPHRELCLRQHLCMERQGR